MVMANIKADGGRYGKASPHLPPTNIHFTELVRRGV